MRNSDDVVGQLTELLDALEIRQPFVLYGFSMGCFITTNYTLRHPDRVRALVLQSPWSHHIPHLLMFFFYVLPGFAEFVAFVVSRAATTVRTRTLASKPNLTKTYTDVYIYTINLQRTQSKCDKSMNPPKSALTDGDGAPDWQWLELLSKRQPYVALPFICQVHCCGLHHADMRNAS